MCYSAQVKADYKKYVQLFGASMSIREFYETFWRRNEEGKLKIPKGMEDAFSDPQTDEEREVKALIDAYRAEQATKFEQEVFKQRKRLADAERTLQTKTTKAATESKRIAGDKIESTMRKLSDLYRTEPRDSDNRIFPQVYAPVIVWEGGRRVIKPMRYQCRPAGKPASYDVQYPGTYSATRQPGAVPEGAVRLHARHPRRERVLRERESTQGGGSRTHRRRSCAEPRTGVQAEADPGHVGGLFVVEMDRAR